MSTRRFARSSVSGRFVSLARRGDRRPGRAALRSRTRSLTLDICQRHKIDPVFYYPSTTFDFARCFQAETVICHANCRADKTDLCLPQWVFDKIEAVGIRIAS